MGATEFPPIELWRVATRMSRFGNTTAATPMDPIGPLPGFRGQALTFRAASQRSDGASSSSLEDKRPTVVSPGEKAYNLSIELNDRKGTANRT